MFDRVSSWQAQVLTVRRGHHVTLLWTSTHVCQCNMWLWRHVHEHAALTSVQQMLKLWGPLPLHQSETIISSWSCARGCCHGDTDKTQSVKNTSSKWSVQIPPNIFMGQTFCLWRKVCARNQILHFLNIIYQAYVINSFSAWSQTKLRFCLKHSEGAAQVLYSYRVKIEQILYLNMK